MRYLLFLLCLLLVACGDEAPATVTPLPTSAPATQTPVVIVVVVTATLEPTKAARPALAATSAPTQPPATASATASPTAPATDTAVSSSPTRRPTRTVTPTATASATPAATVTPSASATPCVNPVAEKWLAATGKIRRSFEDDWISMLSAGKPDALHLQAWQGYVAKGRALKPPAGYEYAGDDWQSVLDTLEKIPNVPPQQPRRDLWVAAWHTYDVTLTGDFLKQRGLECGTPAS